MHYFQNSSYRSSRSLSPTMSNPLFIPMFAGFLPSCAWSIKHPCVLAPLTSPAYLLVPEAKLRAHAGLMKQHALMAFFRRPAEEKGRRLAGASVASNSGSGSKSPFIAGLESRLWNPEMDRRSKSNLLFLYHRGGFSSAHCSSTWKILFYKDSCFHMYKILPDKDEYGLYISRINHKNLESVSLAPSAMPRIIERMEMNSLIYRAFH